MAIFGNKKASLGVVGPIAETFDSLLSEVLAYPVPLPLTKEEFLAMPKDERDKRKRCGYFCPASFAAKERLTQNARGVELVALDIDDADDALQVLVEGVGALLPGFAAAAYHTATSTPAAPRLRVIVRASGVEPSDYSKAVAWLAAKLGIQAPNKESRVLVQPMFFPVTFRGETLDPVVHASKGEPVTGRLIQSQAAPEALPSGAPEEDLGIDHIRPPLQGVTQDEVREMMECLDPSMTRAAWVEVGAALKHQFGEEGFDLWQEWSAQSDKFPGVEEMETQWRSLKVHASGNRASVTLRTLITRAKAAGYEQASASKLILRSVKQSLAAMKEVDTLLHEGTRLIAQESSNLLLTETNQLVLLLGKLLRERNAGVPAGLLTKDVNKIAKKLAREDTLAGKKRETASTEVPAWARGICYVTAADEFYRRATGEKWGMSPFDNAHAFRFVPAGSEDMTPTVRPRDYLLNKIQCPRVANYVYDPREESAFVSYGGLKYVNLYQPDYPDPDESEALEAGATFMDHMEHLIGEKPYRELVVDWLAYQVQNPGEKINWAVLLQGAQGCGKSVLCHLMSKVLGETNVLGLDPQTLISTSWNDWMAGRQLVVLEEVRVVGESRFDVMNKLKPAIANERISVNKRFTDVYSVPNVTNYLLLTNHHDAIAIDDDDRRYFVVESAIQTKKQVERLPAGHFERLFGIDPAGLRAWFLSWKISEAFNPKGHAPMSHYKSGLVDLGRGPIAAETFELLASGENAMVGTAILSSTALLSHLQSLGTRCDRRSLSSVLRDMQFRPRLRRVQINQLAHSIWVRDECRDWTDEQVQDHFNTLL